MKAGPDPGPRAGLPCPWRPDRGMCVVCVCVCARACACVCCLVEGAPDLVEVVLLDARPRVLPHTHTPSQSNGRYYTAITPAAMPVPVSCHTHPDTKPAITSAVITRRPLHRRRRPPPRPAAHTHRPTKKKKTKTRPRHCHESGCQANCGATAADKTQTHRHTAMDRRRRGGAGVGAFWATARGPRVGRSHCLFTAQSK